MFPEVGDNENQQNSDEGSYNLNLWIAKSKRRYKFNMMVFYIKEHAIQNFNNRWGWAEAHLRLRLKSKRNSILANLSFYLAA